MKIDMYRKNTQDKPLYCYGAEEAGKKGILVVKIDLPHSHIRKHRFLFFVLLCDYVVK